MHRTIESWLSEVSSHIKWRSAREPVLTELRQHLEDQREAFEREGVENAEELAVREMGDPCEVGGALNMVHKPHTRVGAMALVMALTAVSAFLQVIFGQREPMAALVMVLCCGVTLFIFGRFDHMVFGRGGIIYFYVLGASLLVLMFSPYVNGVRINVGRIGTMYPMLYAILMYSLRGRGIAGHMGAILGGVPLALICVRANDAAGFFTLLFVGLMLNLFASWYDLFGSGRLFSFTLTGLASLLAAIACTYAVLSTPELLEKLAVTIDPDSSPIAGGYLALRIREVLEASRWIGPAEGIDPIVIRVLIGDAWPVMLICRLGKLPFIILAGGFMALAAYLLYSGLRHRTYLGKFMILSTFGSLGIRAALSIMFCCGFTLFGTAFPFIGFSPMTTVDILMVGISLSVLRSESLARDLPLKKRKAK